MKKVINLLNKNMNYKTDKFVNKDDKFANKTWKGVISKKKKKVCFADKDLSSWTGLGRSGHDRSQSFGSISHVSVPKLNF